MKRIIVFGTGSASLDFLSVAPPDLHIAGMMDNDASKHGTFIGEYEVFSPDRVADLNADYVVITARAVDAIRDGLIARGVPAASILAYYPSFSRRLHDAANHDIRILNEDLGLSLPPIGLSTMYMDLAPTEETVDQPPRDFVRDQAFRLAARRVADRGVEGAVAELGVYQGDQARLLNILFPDRLLYLFDTFTGFSDKDLATESGRGFSSAAVGHFANTSIDLVLGKMRHPDNVRIFQGYFPETATALDERFAFVSLDVDLFEPTLAGLEWFYDRLSPGGYIFVHDYNNRRYLGVRDAVDRFAGARNACCVPLPDFAGSMIVTR